VAAAKNGRQQVVLYAVSRGRWQVCAKAGIARVYGEVRHVLYMAVADMATGEMARMARCEERRWQSEERRWQ